MILSWHLGATALLYQGTASVEDTARRHVKQQGWQTGNTGKVALGLGREQASDEQLCIGAAGALENLTHGLNLHQDDHFGG